MPRLVNPAGVVVEVSDELAATLTGYKPAKSASKDDKAPAKKAAAKSEK